MSKKLRIKNKTHFEAFTLIEILVVVGLIAILAAITIVALNPSKTFARARNSERWNGVRAIHSALEQWLIDGNSISSILEGDGSPIADCAFRLQQSWISRQLLMNRFI